MGGGGGGSFCEKDSPLKTAKKVLSNEKREKKIDTKKKSIA